MENIIGIVMILISCIAFAYVKVREMSKRLRNIKEMKRALFLLRYEVSFSARELWEACDGLSFVLNGEVGELFYRIGIAMREETSSFSACWKALSDGMFSDKAAMVLDSFAATFGTLSKELEEQALEGCEKQLGGICEEEEKELYQNRKLWYTLCPGAGLVLGIFLA